MIRNKINIDNSTFICDLYKYGDTHYTQKKFKLLRNINVNTSGNISTDQIFLIDDELSNITLYPVKDVFNQYSTNKNDFYGNSKINEYALYDQNLNDAFLKCDILRIYHPEIKKNNNNIVVHINSILGNTPIHLLCINYNNCKIGASKQFIINNSYYTEYIEVCIPNIDQLNMNEVYYEENFSKVSVKNSDELVKIKNNKQYCSTSIFGMTCFEDETGKIYYPESANNTIYKINVMLCNVDKDNELENIFNVSETILPGICVFQDTNKISLISKFDFRNSDGKIVLKCIFDYNKNFDSLKSAYEFINNVKLSEYDNIYYEEDDDNYFETPSHKMYQCVYMYQLATDPSFKNIVYSSTPEEGITLINDVKDVEFEITPLFDSFEKMPEILIARVVFIDRYIGTGMFSNSVLITQDIYKYFTVQDGNYALDLNNMSDKFNFINSIKCNVIQNIEEIQKIQVPPQNNKIIYKPVFYKVSDLQSIRLYANQTQNIGINLNNFMTKVETFSMLIDNIKIIESGRNDMYVIFKIPAGKLTSTQGSYHILNQDDEYISSGDWTIV